MKKWIIISYFVKFLKIKNTERTMYNIIKKSYVISVCVLGSLLIGQTVNAQYYYYNDKYYDSPLLFELGASIGGMNSLTDIGGKKGLGGKFVKDLNMGNTQFVGGAHFGILYNNILGVRVEANFGRISGYDSVLSNVPLTDISRARYNRNLSFRTNITEIAVLAELHPLFAFVDWSTKEGGAPRFSPYILAGIGFFNFNPQANLNNRWVDLQPLSTEGQGFPEYPSRQKYKLNALSFPVGLGVKYDLSSSFNIRAEFLYRPTNTDYLDDVSKTYIDEQAFFNNLAGANLANALALHDRQRGEYPPQSDAGNKRGNPKDNDQFFSFNIKFGLIFGRQRR
jgi:opacity protein-like surface antigen